MSWDERWKARGAAAGLALHHPLIERLGPGAGRVLDLAGGAGRNGAWLASQGWDVTVCDASVEGLALASGRGLRTLHADLERDGLPDGPWDAIVSVDYLQRDLFPRFSQVLATGGRVVFCQATTTNLERHPRPSRRFLVDPGELGELIAGYRVDYLWEGWTADGRHEAHAMFG